MQVRRHIGKGQIETSGNNNLRSIAILAIAHEGSVVDGALDDFVGRCFLTYDADVVVDGLLAQGE
eukprot:4798839-Ditylum_brightwellii.AAC.1